MKSTRIKKLMPIILTMIAALSVCVVTALATRFIVLRQMYKEDKQRSDILDQAMVQLIHKFTLVENALQTIYEEEQKVPESTHTAAKAAVQELDFVTSYELIGPESSKPRFTTIAGNQLFYTKKLADQQSAICFSIDITSLLNNIEMDVNEIIEPDGISATIDKINLPDIVDDEAIKQFASQEDVDIVASFFIWTIDHSEVRLNKRRYPSHETRY